MTENKRFTVEIAIHKTREGWANRSIYYINDSLYSAQKTKKVLGASYIVTVPVNAIVIGENREKLAEEVCSNMNALHEENQVLKRHIKANTLKKIKVEDIFNCAKYDKFYNNKEAIKSIDWIAKELGIDLE